MAFSAFDDRNLQPENSHLARVLGDSHELWDQLKSEMEQRFEPLAVDWRYSGKKWGWSLRLKRRTRTVLYMTPRGGHFTVGFALGQKAVEAALESDLPQSALDVIDASKQYAEGRAVRFDVRAADDLLTVSKIATIKMEN